MPDLDFKLLGGSWHGNDLKNVEVVKITGTGISALLYTCFVNIDYDGAGNAYGPLEKDTLDVLQNAGYPRWYYGLIALHPQARLWDMNDRSLKEFNIGTKGPVVKDHYKLQLDARYPDSKGRQPVVQQTGIYKGYFISATSHRKQGSSIYEQSSYLDAASVPFGALSGELSRLGGVRLNDFGLGIRHNAPRQSAFHFADMGSTAGDAKTAVGECSYKVFLDLGGPKKVRGRTPDNRFAVSFLVFPGSGSGAADENTVAAGVRSQIARMGQADNAFELPLLMTFAGRADRGITGKSGLDELKASRSRAMSATIKTLPGNYRNVVAGLTAFGFPGDPLALSIGRIDPAAPTGLRL